MKWAAEMINTFPVSARQGMLEKHEMDNGNALSLGVIIIPFLLKMPPP